MKKLILITMVFISFFSCEKNELDSFDENASTPIATFLGDEQRSLVVSPTSDLTNVITIGVSNLSDRDRVATLEIDNISTLDASVYTLESTSVVIPAGSYTGSTNLISTSGAAFNPDNGLQINLVSVDGANIVGNSIAPIVLKYSPTTGCQFIPSDTVGTYQITSTGFSGILLSSTFEVVAGPGANQITLVNPLGHPTSPEQSYEVIVDITSLESGVATVSNQPAADYDNIAANLQYGTVNISTPETGKVLSCTGELEFKFRYCVSIGCFGTFEFKAQKQ